MLDDGRISGFDSPEKLLETNAIYSEIYKSQTEAGAGDADFDEKK